MASSNTQSNIGDRLSEEIQSSSELESMLKCFTVEELLSLAIKLVSGMERKMGDHANHYGEMDGRVDVEHSAKVVTCFYREFLRRNIDEDMQTRLRLLLCRLMTGLTFLETL